MSKPDASPLPRIDPDRLLLASNREPFRVIRDRRGAVRECIPSMGGLASALYPVLEQQKGTWICWDPEPVASADEGIRLKKEQGDGVPFPLLQVGLGADDIRGYYNGFCNRVLWPMCHTALRRVCPRLDYWLHFRTVNQRFAEAIAGTAPPDQVVWIHDYHLMLVPAAVRQRLGLSQRIGYFHHIPFPDVAVLKALPWHRQLLSGLLGADAIGFHTADYAARFIESCAELLGCDIDSEPGTVMHGRHSTVVRARPIGIDAAAFERLAQEPAVKREAAEIRRKFPSDCLVLSVDRLDYTKGLVERVEAIHELFARLPQCRGLVTFLQIAVPTRQQVPDYQQYRARYEAAVARLNHEFGNDEWQPLIYRSGQVNRRKLVAHYLAADVACVTPVADGMNLVALEYCASQTECNGTLILSRQAGASMLLAEHAIDVDARRKESIVAGFIRALTMSDDERRCRMSELRAAVGSSANRLWRRRCLNDITRDRGTRQRLPLSMFFGNTSGVDSEPRAAAVGDGSGAPGDRGSRFH